MKVTITAMDASTARTLNIREWVEAAGGPAEFSKACGGTWAPAQVSQWISMEKPKGIGHKLARAIEKKAGYASGAMDTRSGSQLVGSSLAKLEASKKFLDDLFDARGRVFVAEERLDLLAAVFDELLRTPEPNLIEMGFRFGRQLDGEENERQGKAGRTGKNDLEGAGQRSAKTKAAAGKSR